VDITINGPAVGILGQLSFVRSLCISLILDLVCFAEFLDKEFDEEEEADTSEDVSDEAYPVQPCREVNAVQPDEEEDPVPGTFSPTGHQRPCCSRPK